MNAFKYIFNSAINLGCAGILLPVLPECYLFVTSGLLEYGLVSEKIGVCYLVTYILYNQKIK